MSKLGGFFARKAGLYDRPIEVVPAEPAPAEVAQTDNPLELDEELFSALGAQVGGENESLRNLLLDANAKMSELDSIKAAFGKLADPVGKTLRALETREVRKDRPADRPQQYPHRLRQAAQRGRRTGKESGRRPTRTARRCARSSPRPSSSCASWSRPSTTSPSTSPRGAPRSPTSKPASPRKPARANALREECRRLDERLSTADKRIIALESDLNAARQRLLMAEDEKRAQQTSLEKASADAARLARRLAEAEASFNAVQGRLRHVEANFAELSNEQARLVHAFDEAKERADHELTSQRMRGEALQARASATEKLLGEAREHLLGRAEEIRDYDRRTGELAIERDALAARVAELEADRLRRSSEFEEVERARDTLMERSAALARAFNAKEAALAHAEEANAELTAQIGVLQATIESDRAATEQTIDELNAALRREKMERSVVEGALETGRKDFARLMREVMALQRGQQQAEPQAEPRAANAA